MKWFINTRRSGKTTKIVEMFMEEDSDSVYLTFSRQAIRHIITPIIFDKYKDIIEKWDKIDNTIYLKNGRKKELASFEKYLQSKEGRKDNPTVFIDEINVWLNEKFGNIKYISGTGPNYKPNYQLPDEYLKEIKKYFKDDDTYNYEFSKEWE